MRNNKVLYCLTFSSRESALSTLLSNVWQSFAVQMGQATAQTRWYAAFQITLCYFQTKQDCTLQIFFIKSSLPKTPTDHCERGHKPRFSSRMTQNPPAKSPLEFVLHQPNTPVCNSLSETPNVGAQLHEKEAFYLKAKYFYPPETLTIQQIMKHIKQRKLKFPSVFILVNILSVLNYLTLIFLLWK